MAGITDQYRTIESGSGWIDRTARGRLRFEGADAVSFLHALLTNDLAGLAAGHGTYAAYLTPQGRMIADLELYRRADGVLAGVAPGVSASLATRFDGLIFAESVTVADVTAKTTELLVLGAAAVEGLARALSLEGTALAALPTWSQISWQDGFVARVDEVRLPGFKIVVPAGHRPRLERVLQAAGVAALSEELAEALRIEAGRPRWGVDMAEETIPLEAGLLERAISTTKGCYVGQEVIIRVLHRGGGRVAKRLMALSIEAPASVPPAGSALRREEREAGRLTSVSAAPSGGVIALGYVLREFADVGQRLAVGDPDEGASATVTGFAG